MYICVRRMCVCLSWGNLFDRMHPRSQYLSHTREMRSTQVALLVSTVSAYPKPWSRTASNNKYFFFSFYWCDLNFIFRLETKMSLSLICAAIFFNHIYFLLISCVLNPPGCTVVGNSTTIPTGCRKANEMRPSHDNS